MKKITLLIFVALLSLCNLMGQKLTDPINNDPNVKIGKLSNGMTYYIRENKKPENRAEFWLLVNAGSMQENENQVGLAHFTEHMGFNGIKGYPGNKLTDELAKIGVTFGRDINAYTSFDETVYTITMPTDNPKNIEMAMNILKGWANDYLLDNKEIEEERGIIIEEYRLRLGAQDRMREKWFPVVFNGSRYAERMPIGTLEVLENFKPQVLKDFYYDWYRPDLQAIVVVGNVNAAEIEKMIIDKFGKIKPKKNPREKLIYPIAPNKDPMVVVCLDKEAGGNVAFMLRKFPHFVMKNVGDYKTKMTHQLFNLMYDGRLSEMLQNPNTPFVGANVGYNSFIGNVDAFSAQIVAKENQIDASIKVIMQEDYRVLKHGFLESELKRAKEELLNKYEIAANEIDKTESNSFASDYLHHFLRQDPIPGAKRVLNYAKKYLEEITLEEVNALAEKWITKDNFCIVIMAPEKEGVAVPSENEILTIIKDSSLENVEPYVDTYKEQEIVEKESLQPGTIISENRIEEVDVTEIILSNNIKVWLKKTDYKNDEIMFKAISKGGASLYCDVDLASALFAPNFVHRAGISEIDMSSLQKKMKGKELELTPDISTFKEEITGKSTPKDFELFFQYLHAFYNSPRYDTTVYELVTKGVKEQLKMVEGVPMYRALRNIIKFVTQNDYYSTLPFIQITYSEDFINSADYERAFDIYKERFANPADFIFVFVGNFDEKVMRDYLELYLGSLKTSEEKDDINPHVVKEFPKEQKIEDIYVGTEEQSFVGIVYKQGFPWTIENKTILSVLKEALDIELIAEIREKMSGVYSPVLVLFLDQLPKPEYFMMVFFGCAPDNTDNLSNAVFKILNDMKENGPSEETMIKVKQQLIKRQETSLKTNEFWQQSLTSYWFQNDDIKTIPKFEERINNLTSKDIADFLQKYFDAEQYVRVNLYPEKE
ncbi:MAG: insulinase family protein [Bacteroidales bacterium]|jgi:zinc protease|nr:insulinase family protein [Bacteroidales bacterium]